MAMTARPSIEDVEAFRQRARDVDPRQPRAGSTPSASAGVLRNDRTDEEELAAVARERELQRMLFDAGLAGICFPTRLRRPGADARPTSRRSTRSSPATSTRPGSRRRPSRPCAAVLLEFGTEEQKLRHLPAILKGEELWMQFLSEPSGGSDVAGALDHRGARRRRVGAQRLEGLDHRRLVVGLGAVPGPDQLGRAQAPRPDGVHAARSTSPASRCTASRCSTAPRSSARSS